MNTPRPQKNRRVVPRWRPSRTEAVQAGPGAPVRYTSDDDHAIELKRRAWNETGALIDAADLVGTAFMLQRHDEARDAAEFLVYRRELLPEDVVNVAESVLQLQPPITEDAIILQEAEVPRKIYDRASERIHNLRLQLIDDPRNALIRADMAREYSAIGQREKAEKLMGGALSLAPGSRFLLRSGARLLVHYDQAAKANQLLNRQRVTRSDPWLLAAEISTAMVAGKTSKLVRTGREVLESQNFTPRYLAELASALATVEYANGRDRQARKLLRASLIDPTDNAVAQAFWAAHEVGSFDPDLESLKIAGSFEARAIDSYWNGEWDDALANYTLSHEDEPFSRWPAVMGSYLASVLGFHERALDMCIQGLLANPGEIKLANNLIVSLTMVGELEKAQQLLSRVRVNTLTPDDQVVITATDGLLHFRTGNPDRGRSLYLDAVATAQNLRNRDLRVAALIYLAREEIRADTELAEGAVKRARQEVEATENRLLATLFNALLVPGYREPQPGSAENTPAGEVK